MDRTEIEVRLNRDRAWLLEAYTALPSDVLLRPSTPSESGASTMWTALDHLAHLIGIERTFNELIERFVGGDVRPISVTSNADGSRKPIEEIMPAVHRANEDWVERHRGKTLPLIIALGQQVRAETLALLGRLSDEQLLQKLPGAPWADGTVGGVISTNAGHGRMHWKWLQDAGVPPPPK